MVLNKLPERQELKATSLPVRWQIVIKLRPQKTLLMRHPPVVQEVYCRQFRARQLCSLPFFKNRRGPVLFHHKTHVRKHKEENQENLKG